MQAYRILQKVVELNSFTKAADALGYTQSAISQNIATLEAVLSLKLLHRSRTGVQLSQEGQALYPLIEQPLLIHQRIQEKADEINQLERGVICIGTVSSISIHWLPTLMRDFQALYPNVEFILHQGDYRSIQDWIKTNSVDFGFVTPAAVSNLQTQAVKDGPMLAVLPADHPLAQKEIIPLEDLAQEDFILLEEGHYSDTLQAFKNCQLQPRIKYTIHDDYAIMTMVEAGHGVSILAELALKRTAYQIAIRPTQPEIIRRIAIAYRLQNELPLAAQRFIDFLLSRVDQLA